MAIVQNQQNYAGFTFEISTQFFWKRWKQTLAIQTDISYNMPWYAMKREIAVNLGRVTSAEYVR